MTNDILILSATDVDKTLESIDLQVLIRSQETAFRTFSSQTPDTANGTAAVQIPLRSTIQSDEATTLFMPSRSRDVGTAIKIVSVPKVPTLSGLPASTVVLDDSGRVTGLLNAARLTSMRNACGMSSSYMRIWV
jgi:ornithine cyclodeaminase/alanine dehydrogenase-like protein (mu-crystallin family)